MVKHAELEQKYFALNNTFLHDVFVNGEKRSLRLYQDKSTNKFYSTYLTTFEKDNALFEVVSDDNGLTWKNV